VLDLGCGIGRNGIQIAGFASTIVGYDISDVAVTKANENAKSTLTVALRS
jgi:predicted TPR repeat methyltransferase